MDTLIFVDTNIFLDFYRDPALKKCASLLKGIGEIGDRLIVTSQLEAEFKANRQNRIFESIAGLRWPSEVNLSVPGLLADADSAKKINRLKIEIREGCEKLKKNLENILLSPNEYDQVWKTLEPIFTKETDYNLNFSHLNRQDIERLALERYQKGLPPRKVKDHSIGDAINWEWMIACSKKSQKDVVIVSRDGDYGLRLGDSWVVNDWLGSEFRSRSAGNKIILTGRLTDAFRQVKISVTKNERDLEKKLVDESAARQKMVYDLVASAAAGLFPSNLDLFTSPTLLTESLKICDICSKQSPHLLSRCAHCMKSFCNDCVGYKINQFAPGTVCINCSDPIPSRRKS